MYHAAIVNLLATEPSSPVIGIEIILSFYIYSKKRGSELQIRGKATRIFSSLLILGAQCSKFMSMFFV